MMATPEAVPVSIYPKNRKLTLSLEIQIKDREQDEYVFENPDAYGEEADKMQLGFIADLFDLLNFEANLGVSRINDETPETIKAKL